MKQVWFTKDGYGEMCAHLEKPTRDEDGRLDGIPDGVRAAAAEARDCEAL